jgi:hypothetical protein
MFWLFHKISSVEISLSHSRKLEIDGALGLGRSFENRSFEFSSKTGQQMDWGPPGLTFSTFYCFPNLT